MPRGVASSYAPRATQDITSERYLRERLAAERQRRQDEAIKSLDDAALSALRLYQQEKARAARQGKPVLSTYERWRSNVLPEETPTK